MPLVAYASSSSDEAASPSPRKRARTTTAQPSHELDPSPRPPVTALSHGAQPPKTSHVATSATPTAAALPPLPSSFHNLYATNARVSTHDDPSLHAGRKRQVPHAEGNWPSHVFIEWHPTRAEATRLDALVDSAATSSHISIHSALTSELGVPLPLHISLSAPLVLRTEQRAGFLSRVTQSVRSACAAGGFEVRLRGCDWACNAEGTRWFLAQRMVNEGRELERLLRGCNKCAEEVGQPALYAERGGGGYKQSGRKGKLHGPAEGQDVSARFHFSVGWSLERPLPEGQSTGPAEVSDEALEGVEGMTVQVDAVQVKIGNVVTSVDLPKR